MDKIRIGNDLSFAIDLRQYLYPDRYLEEREVYTSRQFDFEIIDDNEFVNKSEVYSPGQTSNNTTTQNGGDGTITALSVPLSIREVKAYVINTTKLNQKKELDKKPKFISRYPIEPFVNAFDSTAYDICSSGYPVYHCHPYPHRIVPYGGFGVNPCWDGIYKKVYVEPQETYKYQVPCYATSKLNVIGLRFPANSQKYCGVYDIVIVAKVYSPGYNSDNLRTITIDIPKVFQLVPTTAEGSTTGIHININRAYERVPELDEIAWDDQADENSDPSYRKLDAHVKSAGFNGDVLLLSLNDGYTTHSVDFGERDGWYNDPED